MLTRALWLERLSKSAKLGSWIEPKSPGVYINLAASAFEDTQDAHIPNTSGADPTWPQSRLLFQKKKMHCHRGTRMEHFLIFRLHTHTCSNIACYCRLLQLLIRNFDLASDYSVNFTVFSIFAYITPRDPGYLCSDLRLILKIKSDTFRQNAS